MRFHSAGHRAGCGDLASDRKILFNRTAREDSTTALLRQGSEEGWKPSSYLRVADYFDRRDPIACLFWMREARRCRK